MRNKIIISFTLIFALFLLGSGVTIYHLVNTTARLRYLIGLHEIEDIRQELFSSIQRASSYVFASPEIFNDHLDEIIAHTTTMHNAIRRCNDCHHEPGVQQELAEMQQQVDRFEKKLSYLITIIADSARRHSLQEEVYHASTSILSRVQNMVNRAAKTIDRRTVAAMNDLNRVYIIVGATLLGTILLALLIARYLTGKITGPIDALLRSTRRITSDEWGYQTDYTATGEFQELIAAFNQMSESLAIKREQEKVHLQKLRDTQKQLIEAEKLSALGTMAGGIAHDFNNILCGMIGHLNILARMIPEDEDTQKIINTIEKAGFRAADLVKQLLTFARQRPMEQHPLDMNACINDVVKLVEKTFDRLIELELALEENIPAVLGDAAQLEQVVINLCINARDAMPEGGKITIRTGVFEPDEKFSERHREARPGKYVLLAVEDTGCGINEKVLPRIFDPFFTTKEVGKGTGLGLAMVYGIVQSHSGFCTIDSAPGRGTSVNVYIPAIDGKIEQPSHPPSSHSPGGRTIMIVDDEPMVAAMLQSHLEQLGCKTLLAENGQVAVDMLQEMKDEIDMVILDINMPVMCGRDAYHQFVRIKPDIRVLVSTGYIMNEDTHELLNMGAQGFLQKPYKLEDINRKIVEIFQRESAG